MPSLRSGSMRSSSFCAAANSSDATALASPPAIPLPLTVATRSPGRSDAPATARGDSRTMPAERDDSICRPVPGTASSAPHARTMRGSLQSATCSTLTPNRCAECGDNMISSEDVRVPRFRTRHDCHVLYMR